MYAEDEQTIRGIVRILNAEGIASARGYTWTNASLHKLLRSETYAGRAFYNKRTTLDVGDGITQAKRRKVVNRDPSEVIPIAVTSIVDGVTFERVQRKLDFNREAIRQRARRFYLLSGMVVCAKCGRRYTVQTEPARNGRDWEARQYRHRQSDGHCADHMISARKLEPPIWSGIVKVLLDPAELARGHEASLAAQREKLAQAREHLDTLRRNLTRLDKRQAGLVRIYADGDISRAEYLAQRTELDRERGELAAQIQAIEEQLAALPSEGDLESLQAFGEDIRGVFAAGDIPDETRREILQKMNVRIVISEDHTTATVSGIFQAFDCCLLSKS
jgi:site-specific DNA recombinase